MVGGGSYGAWKVTAEEGNGRGREREREREAEVYKKKSDFSNYHFAPRDILIVFSSLQLRFELTSCL